MRRFVLRRVASLPTGTIGLVIYKDGQCPFKPDRDRQLYTLIEGREVRLRDLFRRHVKRLGRQAA